MNFDTIILKTLQGCLIAMRIEKKMQAVGWPLSSKNMLFSSYAHTEHL